MTNTNPNETVTGAARDFLQSTGDLSADVLALRGSLKGASATEKRSILQRISSTETTAAPVVEAKDGTSDVAEAVVPIDTTKALSDTRSIIETALPSQGGSLRERRQRATTKALSVAPKLELLEGDKQPSPDALPVEQPKDAPAALEAIHEAADKGIEAALPSLNKEAEELAPLVVMERFDESGTLMPKSDTLVTKDKFLEGGVVVADPAANKEIIADALKTNNELAAVVPTPAEANDLRAARLLNKAPVVSEKPIADMAPETTPDNIDGSFLPESVQQKKASAGDGDANIIFGRNESKPVGAIEDKALEHDGNGSADLKRPDRMEPVLQGGLAPLTEPVISEDVANLAPDKVDANADKLVSEAGGLAEVAPVKVAVDNSEAKISEPHPFVAADAPTPEKAVSVAGEETDEQILERMTRTGESLDGTVPVAETPVEVKAAPEVAIATPEVGSAQSGFKPELLRGNEQPSAALKAVPPVVQPEAPAVANADPSGIWQPKAKKGIFSKWFGDKHAAHELAYVKNPNITAEQVLGHVGTEDGADTPQVAEKAA